MSVTNTRHGLKFKPRSWTKTTSSVMTIPSRTAKLFPVKPLQTCKISKRPKPQPNHAGRQTNNNTTHNNHNNHTTTTQPQPTAPQIVLHTKAFGQDVFKVEFSSDREGTLVTSGTGHIRFWKMAETFTGQSAYPCYSVLWF